MHPCSAKQAATGWGPKIKGLVRASSADAPLSKLIKAISLKATATRLTVMIAWLSQSSREARLDVYLSLCCLDAGCEERRKMTLALP